MTSLQSSTTNFSSRRVTSDLDITLDDIRNLTRCGASDHADIFMFAHRRLGKVVLKRPRYDGSASEIEAERNEIRERSGSWRALKHSNVLNVYGTLDLGQIFYIVCDYAENGSLSEYIHAQPRTDRLPLLAEALAGIEYLHAQGIVHGRIKAANILVSVDVHALVSDFDIPPEQEHVYATMKAGDTPWMSPETIEGKPRTFASDVWSVGMLIYEVLSGRHPFYDSPGYAATVYTVVILKRLPPQEPKYGVDGTSYADAWTLASDCWQRDPSKRIRMDQARDRLPVQHLEDGDLSKAVSARDLESALQGRPARIEYQITLGDSRRTVVFKRLAEFGSQSDVSEYRRGFKRQSSKWIRLQHPHIREYYGFIQHRQDIYWMSAAVGDTRKYLRLNPDADRLEMLANLASGLAYLHDEGIIHGDIMASNTHTSDGGRIVIGEYGWTVRPLALSVANLGRDALSGTDLSQLSNWTCPEYLTTGLGKTFAGDVWAFGMLIYEILSGEVPYFNYSNEQVMAAIVKGDLPPTKPSASGKGLSYQDAWDVAARCWKFRPEDRITMKEAYELLTTRRQTVR